MKRSQQTLVGLTAVAGVIFVAFSVAGTNLPAWSFFGWEIEKEQPVGDVWVDPNETDPGEINLMDEQDFTDITNLDETNFDGMDEEEDEENCDPMDPNCTGSTGGSGGSGGTPACTDKSVSFQVSFSLRNPKPANGWNTTEAAILNIILAQGTVEATVREAAGTKAKQYLATKCVTATNATIAAAVPPPPAPRFVCDAGCVQSGYSAETTAPETIGTIVCPPQGTSMPPFKCYAVSGSATCTHVKKCR